MNSTLKNSLKIVLFSVFTFPFISCSSNNKIPVQTELKLELFNGKTVSLCSEQYITYLNAKKENDIIESLVYYGNGSADLSNVVIRWQYYQGFTFKTSIADNKKLDNAIVIESNIYDDTCRPGFLMPGKTYYYQVEAYDASGNFLEKSIIDYFKTSNKYSVRPITLDGTRNVRDLGGYKTDCGKRIKYGLIYRGACTNDRSGYYLSKTALKTANEVLGINGEIDLRHSGDDTNCYGVHQEKNYFDENKPYLKASITQACYIFPSFKQTDPMVRNYDTRTASSLRNIFSFLADESNYPVYFHCNAGADRTGTLAYLISGYLGVKYDDLVKDFELTSLSPFGTRLRSNYTMDSSYQLYFDDTGVYEDDNDNYIAFGKMHNMMMEIYGKGSNKVSDAIYNYLTSSEIGVKAEDLAKLKSIMLG